ncbi:MAG: hypothetical protein ACP5JB_06245 [candidate division WOR-3 bacterium]
MRAKKKTRKKRSVRLKGKPCSTDSVSFDKEAEPEDTFFGVDEEMENDIIDIDEMENFNYNSDEPDESEW